jgi:hypothetical protein
MRSLIVLTLTSATLTLAACNSPQWPEPRRTTMNAWSVNEYQRASIEAGIVAQHTLYPHHFVSNGAELNELGMRDVCVLADHYKDNPGSLNVRRNGTPAELYKQRVATVSAMLTSLGVDTDRVHMSGSLPGGDGISSERVLVILAEKMDQPLSEDDKLSTFDSE